MLESGGLDIDIESGRPLKSEDVLANKKHKEERRQARAVSRYQGLVNDLSGDGGEIIKQIAGLYIDRINDLIKEDATCVAYQSIFDNIGIKINIGKRIVKAKREEIEEL